MELESYFDFLSDEDIRIKGTRIAKKKVPGKLFLFFLFFIHLFA